jgi:hypothetical protein
MFMEFVHRSKVSSDRLNEDFVDQNSRFVVNCSSCLLSIELFVMFLVPVVGNVPFPQVKDPKCSSLCFLIQLVD